MILIKKLVFGLLFLAFLLGTIIFSFPLLKDSSLIFSLNQQTFISLIVLSILILATSLTFAIFKALTFGLVLLSPPSSLLPPTIKRVAMLLMLALSIFYYLSMNKDIARNGFDIPDSLIDSSLKLMPQTNLPSVQGVKYISQLPQITPEQIELLKQNPDLLRQYNIDPKMLDSLPSETTNPPTELVKPLIKEQLQAVIKPYQNIIPIILALLFFLTLQFFVSMLEILLPAIIWLTFYILEKSGFIAFTTEMREVKKLVI